MLSRPSRARGLKQQSFGSCAIRVFASITGAWIETWYVISSFDNIDSRPSRARGLKHDGGWQ